MLFNVSGLAINILRVGDKSPMQGGFFENNMGNLLPALRFLDELYNFCNFVTMIRRRAITLLICK